MPELFLFFIIFFMGVHIHIYVYTLSRFIAENLADLLSQRAFKNENISTTANDNDFSLITFHRKININFVNMFRQTWIGACLHYISRMKIDHPDLILSIRLYLSFIYRSNSVRSNEHLCKFGALFAGDFDIIDKIRTPFFQ